MGIHWFILSAAAVILIQGWIFRRFGMKRLSYAREFSVKSCFEGDKIEMIERLENRKWLPVPWMRVESILHTGLKFENIFNFDVSNGQFYQNHKSLFSLMGNKQLTRRHPVQCVQRGCYRLTSASITFGDLFGLFRSWKSVTLQEELIVYPMPADRSLIQLPSRSWQGDISVRRWIVEDPFYVTGVRDYQAGDSLKSINWNATARSSKMQVHRRDFTADYRLMVLLNVEDHADMWEIVNNTALIEQGIRLAAALVQYATEQGLETGFATNGHDIDIPGLPVITEMSSGSEHLLYMLERMAKLAIASVTPFYLLIDKLEEQMDERCDVVIVSAFMSDKIELAVERLRSHGHGVEWLPLALQAGDAA